MAGFSNVLKKNKKGYQPLLKRKDWPVVRLSKNRKAFIHEVAQDALNEIYSVRSDKLSLIEDLELTLYREQLRIKQNPWKVDPEDERDFWKGIKQSLVGLQAKAKEEKEQEIHGVLETIVSRYSEEIAGNFRPSRYHLARRLVTFGFARLLNASRIKRFGAFWTGKLTLRDKIHIRGEIDMLRELSTKGTIIIVPTHFSNLDSVLIGWIIQSLGLPPFIYGAGLNLFNISVFAYFMNSLGAYKVDRRKKNLPYLETLKSYSKLAIRDGCHSLFFPGGTRSRSGQIESQLKLGLLSSAMEAQRILYETGQGDQNKIFIVPVVINYHFVLEAPSLINDYLKRSGQERYYVENDRFSNSLKILTFLFKFFTKGSDISVNIGEPMDLLGNKVDSDGNSYDKQGRIIKTKEYFTSPQGIIARDRQREGEYTRKLSKIIVESFYKINRVFSSHLVAFVAFEMLKRKHKKVDLYNLLRLPEDEQSIEYASFRATCNNVREQIFYLKEKGKIDVADHLTREIDEVIGHGLYNVGMYHDKRPLLKTKKGNIITKDLNTLFYYHNRLEGYDLDQYIG